jgi:hypothetical protein
MAEKQGMSEAGFLKSLKTTAKNKWNETAKETEGVAAGFSDLPEGLVDSPQQISGGGMGQTAKEKGAKPYFRVAFVSLDPTCPGKKWSKNWTIGESKANDGTIQKTTQQAMARFASDLQLMGVAKEDITDKDEDKALGKLVKAFKELLKSNRVILFNTSRIGGKKDPKSGEMVGGMIYAAVQGVAEMDGEEENPESGESEDDSPIEESSEAADGESSDDAGEPADDDEAGEPVEDEGPSIPEAGDVVYKNGKAKGIVISVDEAKGLVMVWHTPAGKQKAKFNWKLAEITANPA